MRSTYRNIVVLGFGNIGRALSSLLRMCFTSEHILVIDELMASEYVVIADRYAMDFLQCGIDKSLHELPTICPTG
jgi:hypothetical protein